MQTRRLIQRGLFMAIAMLVAMPQHAMAQYCALRDPVRKIYELFPEATSYRSIVKTVDEETRRTVSERLSLELHFNELGRHTLYVAFQDEVPIGLIHVRAEKGRWGLNENTWAFDLDLRIRGFTFQRCRDPHRLSIEAELFQRHLLGSDLATIESKLDDEAQNIVDPDVSVPAEAEPLALSVLHSAMKTIVVTEQVWKSDLEILRATRLARLGFPGSESVEMVENAYSRDVLQKIQHALGGESGIDRVTARVLRVVSKDEAVMGTIVCARWRIGDERVHLGWVVSPTLELLHVIPVGDWPNDDVKQACLDVQGLHIADVADCATPMQLAGAEALLLSQVHSGLEE